MCVIIGIAASAIILPQPVVLFRILYVNYECIVSGLTLGRRDYPAHEEEYPIPYLPTQTCTMVYGNWTHKYLSEPLTFQARMGDQEHRDTNYCCGNVKYSSSIMTICWDNNIYRYTRL
ncbi:hypothetical protein DFS33DRAFT_1340578 [Desarmillaria ectypa]|nr:hypothetical protein DFS33DRAFT_1340578 [Desarmillaria ectypa]